MKSLMSFVFCIVYVSLIVDNTDGTLSPQAEKNVKKEKNKIDTKVRNIKYILISSSFYPIYKPAVSNLKILLSLSRKVLLIRMYLKED